MVASSKSAWILSDAGMCKQGPGCRLEQGCGLSASVHFRGSRADSVFEARVSAPLATRDLFRAFPAVTHRANEVFPMDEACKQNAGYMQDHQKQHQIGE
jgi:hypothetical protein